MSAYSTRAAEHTTTLGAMPATNASDRQIIDPLNGGAEETALDSGCGPQRWKII